MTKFSACLGLALCCLIGILVLIIGIPAGCVRFPEPDGEPTPPEEAEYVGRNTCLACHPNLSNQHDLHGHSQALNRIEGAPPAYPAEVERAGVPEPPPGFEWFDISYVIDGYTKGARFVDEQGYVLMDEETDEPIRYTLPNDLLGREGQFVPPDPQQISRQPFTFENFRRWTTGAMSLAENGGRNQDNLPGIQGTWAEPGVQCEECHGPGSRHLINPEAGNIEVDGSSADCANCHIHPDNSNTLVADNNFIVGLQQYTEVQASPHRDFSCTVCHDPHTSVIYEQSEAIRNECQDCHSEYDMAFHEGFVFEKGDYRETLTCKSCHMPFAVKRAVGETFEIPPGQTVRIGDTRSHLVTIDVDALGSLDMFSMDGTEVVRDENGMASVTACYVCQRCHNGRGNAFPLTPDEGCTIARLLHVEP